MQIEKNMVTSFRYIMKNGKGDILEDTMNTSPISYVHGSTSIQAELQSQLEGLKVGDKKMVYLKAKDVSTDEDFTFDITIDAVRAASEDEVLLGHPVKEKDAICGPGCNC